MSGVKSLYPLTPIPYVGPYGPLCGYAPYKCSALLFGEVGATLAELAREQELRAEKRCREPGVGISEAAKSLGQPHITIGPP